MITEKQKKIIYVRSNFVVEAANQCAQKLQEELNIKIESVSSIHDIFPKLSDPSFNPDAIVIAIEDFYDIKGADVFDIVNTLSTLIKCTVFRDGNKTKRRTTEIIAIVGDETDRNLIKGLMSIPNIHLGLRLCDSFTYEDIANDVRKYLFNQDFSVPKKIQDLLKTKKPQVQSRINTFDLTPRQLQILTIVVSRGASNKVIAKMLNLSESTIKLHMSAIFKKYGVRNRTQLAVFAQDSNKSMEIKNV